jgi:hypothetical protein
MGHGHPTIPPFARRRYSFSVYVGVEPRAFLAVIAAEFTSGSARRAIQGAAFSRTTSLGSRVEWRVRLETKRLDLFT